MNHIAYNNFTHPTFHLKYVLLNKTNLKILSTLYYNINVKTYHDNAADYMNFFPISACVGVT